MKLTKKGFLCHKSWLTREYLSKYHKNLHSHEKKIARDCLLFIITKDWIQLTCPSVGEGIHKLWDSHTREYYSVIKRNKLLIHTSMWTSLGCIVLSTRPETIKFAYSVILFMWHLAKPALTVGVESRGVIVSSLWGRVGLQKFRRAWRGLWWW